MNLNKIEQINKESLKTILCNFDKIVQSFELDDDDVKGMKTLLIQYHKKCSDDGIVKVKYNQINGSGRLFAHKSLSLQSMKRQIRQTICHTYYDDVDMVNAHPVILQHICKEYKIDTPYLNKYVKHRNRILEKTGLPREKAKTYYLMMMNSNDLKLNLTNNHMKRFYEEMKTIQKKIYFLNKTEADIHISQRKQKGKFKNSRASYVNTLLCDFENKILTSILDFHNNPKDCVLCFDGLMLRKGIHKTINDIEIHIKQTLGIDMKLKVKEMNDVLDLSIYHNEGKIIDNTVYQNYKPVPKFERKADYYFERKYISIDLKDSYYNDIDTNLVLKSDTGTGKTSSFSTYIHHSQSKFISVGCRISLLDQQFSDFTNDDNDCIHYNYHKGTFKNGDNVLIMLDSIHRIRHLDVSDYVVYMDEFAFLIEYMLTSDTMKNSRVMCMVLLIKLIKNCKQFICTDADIGLICMSFLDLIKVDYKYHQNEYKYCEGNNVKASEINNIEDIVEQLKTLDKYLVCCDSKTVVDGLSRQLDDPSVMCYTSDLKKNKKVDIESYDKVIISPKVIPGVDSKKERKVFAVYKEHTITAKHMIQQVNRCRNILHLYYYFPYKHYTKPKYQSLDEVIQEIEEQDKLYDFEVLTMLCTCNNGLDITAIFKQLYAMTLYEHDCVNTNKYLHFKNIMKERGIQDDKARVESKKLNLVSRKTLIQEKVENFNVEELKAKFEEDGTVIMGKSNEVNDILQIPDEELNDYKQYLVDESLLQKHWQFCRFFISKDEKKKLDKALEFQCRKTISIKGKLYTLRHIVNKFDITLNKGEQLTVNNQNITDTERKDMLKLYKTSFRCRDSKVNFKNNNQVLQKVVSSMKNMLGGNIITSKRISSGNNRTTNYILNSHTYEHHQKLYRFRNYKQIEIQENTIDMSQLKKRLF